MMNDATRLARARTFDEVAELYDRARPECRDEILQDLFVQSGIKPLEATVLEIGCGTGQATLPLARRGCRVLGVEMGENLARIAVRNLAGFPRVRIAHAQFEHWDPKGESFDLVFAANSWHWLDPAVRYAKAAALLRPAGLLAFTSWNHAFPPDFDPFFTEIQTCYEAIGEDPIKWPPPTPEQVPDLREETERSGYFDHIRTRRHMWIEEFSADQYINLMRTASNHRLFEPNKREWLFDQMRGLIKTRPGGRILKHNLIILHFARRTSTPPSPTS